MMSGIEQVQVWASVATATATLLTLGVLVVYTRETCKLRREAQRQNDNAEKPIVMLERATDLPVLNETANMPADKVVLRNLGLGAAFNIEVEPLRGLKSKIEFHHTTSLAVGDRQSLWMSIWEDEKLVHTVAYQHIQRLFHKHELVSHTSGVISYSDVHGKRYRTVLTYQYDNLTKELTLKLDRVELDSEG